MYRFNTQPPEGGWDGLEVKPRKLQQFQHTAARRRLAIPPLIMLPMLLFQHTAARRRLGKGDDYFIRVEMFQHTAARRRLARRKASLCACSMFQHTAARRRLGPTNRPRSVAMQCFNTQPPEGGWREDDSKTHRLSCFNTQPPEGGWGLMMVTNVPFLVFQHTAARRRLAGWTLRPKKRTGFNTQPPEGGWAVFRRLLTPS